MFPSPDIPSVLLGCRHEEDEPSPLSHVGQSYVGLVDLAVRGCRVDGVDHHVLLGSVFIQLLLKYSAQSLSLKKLSAIKTDVTCLVYTLMAILLTE